MLSFLGFLRNPVYILERQTSTLFPYSFSDRSCLKQTSDLYNPTNYVQSTPLDGDFVSWALAGPTAAPEAPPADGAPADSQEA